MASQIYIDGEWLEGDPPLLTANSLATWLSSMVFDGARAFRGLAPDLDLHCERVVQSARLFGLKPYLTAAEIEAIAWDGIRRFPANAELYIRPMYWADNGFVAPDPESTRFALAIEEMPIPKPTGFSACLSSFARPAPNTAPTDAKASCLYPNAARALTEAKEKGFDNAVVLDLLGNVAEFATANLFFVKDGVAVTPIPNGTFLNGITRQRVIQLLREDGVEVVERAVNWPEVLDADEIFSTGNYAKVSPVKRIENRDLQPGPIAKRAYDLYFNFAQSATA
ncbi:MAG: branched-chain amino acid aminotransferase [Alphaproteobacteria bacterium]|nr:branched-chain amino acid aminotransferase [Alphaproteobacteria bacterium]